VSAACTTKGPSLKRCCEKGRRLKGQTAHSCQSLENGKPKPIHSNAVHADDGDDDAYSAASRSSSSRTNKLFPAHLSLTRRSITPNTLVTHSTTLSLVTHVAGQFGPLRLLALSLSLFDTFTRQ
jgi:hypothetical protein